MGKYCAVLLRAKMQLPVLCRGVLLFLFGSQGERGEMRKRALMMVLGKLEREILIAFLISSYGLVVAAVWLGFTP